MAEFTIEDSLKKHDKDKDGQISKKEFLGELIILVSIKELERTFLSLTEITKFSFPVHPPLGSPF